MVGKEYLTYWGYLTEPEARETLRYIHNSQHEADESGYSYEPSTKYPHLFVMVQLIDQED